MMQFTESEVEFLQRAVGCYLSGGVETPPYSGVVYDVIEKLGVSRDDFAICYDISRPSSLRETWGR